MAYDRYDSRRGWREPRSRLGEDFRDQESERGFFDRAGDEVASWFGDEDAERRRREDMRRFGDDESSRFDRSARFRDEGYRRPYTGRSFAGRGFGDDNDRGFGADRGSFSDRWTPDRQRDFSGSSYDPHYSEWRRRQLNELDRDYDDYRRENQSRFESEFSSWRTQRQGKRELLGTVREHMSVVGSDQEHVGTVDHVRGDHIVLTENDSDDGRHHRLSCSSIDRVEGDQVILDKPAAEAKQRFLNEERGSFRDGDEREDSRILNRAFSSTYER